METFEGGNYISEAQELHRQITAAGFDYGCLEVSLTALGAKFTLEMVDRTDRKALSLNEVMDKSGLKVNWLVAAEERLGTEDIEDLLLGKVVLEESYPQGEVLGYLWVETIPYQKGHSVAIFPVDGAYMVMDIEVGGLIQLTAENLAHMGNRVLALGGRFEIAQIKR